MNLFSILLCKLFYLLKLFFSWFISVLRLFPNLIYNLKVLGLSSFKHFLQFCVKFCNFFYYLWILFFSFDIILRIKQYHLIDCFNRFLDFWPDAIQISFYFFLCFIKRNYFMCLMNLTQIWASHTQRFTFIFTVQSNHVVMNYASRHLLVVKCLTIKGYRLNNFLL